MKNFEYAQPTTEDEAVTLLTESDADTAILAGGTDLVGLMKRMVVTPDRVVNICEIPSLRQIERDSDGSLRIGAAVCLDDFLHSSLTDSFPSVKQVIQGISSLQLQAQGTVGGELLRRPTCWYFRDGHGLLAENGRMVVEGDNRYHAILGNRGPAKFCSASRLAPALISLGAKVRVVGPEPEQEQLLDLTDLYRTPTIEDQRETVLQTGQLVTHIILPPHGDRLSAAFEVRHGEGPDQPLAAAAVSLRVLAGVVQEAQVVLGQVAPVPWNSSPAAQALRGRTLSEQTAEAAGIAAVSGAAALSQNEYKIQLTQVAVRRAVLKAAGLETGGLETPFPQEPTAAPSQDTHIA